MVITAIDDQNTFGVEELMDIIATNTDLRLLSMKNSIAAYESYRRTTGAKIIAAFSGVCSAIGAIPLPGLDIVATTLLNEVMVRILAVLSTVPGRTASTFREIYHVAYTAISGARVALLALSTLLDLTGVFLPIGSAIGAAGAGGCIALIGWRAYKYFTSKAML